MSSAGLLVVLLAFSEHSTSHSEAGIRIPSRTTLGEPNKAIIAQRQAPDHIRRVHFDGDEALTWRALRRLLVQPDLCVLRDVTILEYQSQFDYTILRGVSTHT